MIEKLTLIVFAMLFVVALVNSRAVVTSKFCQSNDTVCQTSNVLLNSMMVAATSNSSNTLDYSEYGINGGVTGATYNTTTNAYDLNGSNWINYTTGFNFDKNPFAIELYVYPRGYYSHGSVYNSFMGKGQISATPYTSIFTDSNNRFIFNVGNATTGNGVNSLSTGLINNWYHVVGMRNISGSIVLYVNGVYQGVSNQPNIVNASSPTSFLYAGRDLTTSRTCNCSIGFMRIYNDSLTQEQVSNLYNNINKDYPYLGMNEYAQKQRTGLVDDIFRIGNLPAYSTDNVIINLPFLNSTSNGSMTTDYSNYNQTFLAMNATYDSTGQQYDFDGYYKYMSFNHSASQNLTQNFSIEAWVYPTANHTPSHGSGIVSKENSQNSGQYELWFTTTGYFGFRGSWNIAWGVTCDDTLIDGNLNEWYHVFATMQHLSGNTYQYKCYLNGVLEGTASTSLVPNITTAEPLWIGTRSSIGSAPHVAHFNGSISSILIYNETLDANQILAKYQQGREEKNIYPYIGVVN